MSSENLAWLIAGIGIGFCVSIPICNWALNSAIQSMRDTMKFADECFQLAKEV